MLKAFEECLPDRLKCLNYGFSGSFVSQQNRQYSKCRNRAHLLERNFFFFNLDLMQPLKYSFHINIYQLQISEVTHFSFLMELSEGELTLP